MVSSSPVFNHIKLMSFENLFLTMNNQGLSQESSDFQILLKTQKAWQWRTSYSIWQQLVRGKGGGSFQMAYVLSSGPDASSIGHTHIRCLGALSIWICAFFLKRSPLSPARIFLPLHIA